MKIVLIVNFFPPKWLGGTEIASYNIAKCLARKGHEVHVITSFDKGFQKTEIKDHFYIHRIINFRKIKYIGPMFFLVFTFFEIKKINPDIIHIQSIPMAIPGLLSKIFLKKKYVVWGQGSDVYLPNKYIKLISKTLLNNASAVIALSEDMKRNMKKVCNRKDIAILPNGIELENFTNVLSKKQDNTEKVILFVGTLRPVKGVEYLIKAMRIINEKFPDISLLIIGDGPDREKLETLVLKLNLQNSIHFIGKVSNTEIPGYMAQAELFALPSLSEGFPLVIAEAMASGLPIVATNIRGLPDIVINGKNGFVVEPKNPGAIAEKIIFLLNNKSLCKKISEINRKTSEEYSWSKITDKLEEIYKKIGI